MSCLKGILQKSIFLKKDLTCISDYAQIVENAQIRYFATKQQSRKLLFLLKNYIRKKS